MKFYRVSMKCYMVNLKTFSVVTDKNRVQKNSWKVSGGENLVSMKLFK